MEKKHSSLVLVYLWLSMLFLLSVPFYSPASAEEPKGPKLKPIYSLLFGELNLFASGSYENSTTIPGEDTPITFKTTPVYSYGISYDKKPIIAEWLKAFPTEKEVPKWVQDIFIDPIKFDAKVSQAKSITPLAGKFTEDLEEETIWSIGVSYVLPVETFLSYVVPAWVDKPNGVVIKKRE